ncbi:tudor domain-containing protein 10 [Elgaria multicarinata webbii]|uniref:tudor domain-containing protein 10 n=1 Tax=Elgaria multicarinata webbii TaxID=159646 RepID=UPI002FCD013C
MGFGFLELTSPEAVQLAIQQLDGNLVNGRPLKVAVSEDRRVHQPPKINLEMPDLELVSYEELDPVPKAGTQSALPLKLKVCYAVPMEMRSSFLLHMLRDCFNNVGWLFSVAKVLGKVGLLVMDTIPQTPYFWAIHLTEECHQNMLKLFTSLAEVESQLPFLAKQDVQRGTRCLAECIVGDEGKAWNRCWVLDKSEDLAVVFFVDFGCLSTVTLNSLRKLDKDEFWVINPLAQPFMLQEDVLPPQVMMRQILEGEVVGPWLKEPHILKFIPKRTRKNSREPVDDVWSGVGQADSVSKSFIEMGKPAEALPKIN